MKRKRQALSFLELLVAMTLMFLAVTFVMGLFLSGVRNSEKATKMTRSTFLSQSKMEHLLALPVEQLNPGNGTLTLNGVAYNYQVDISSAGDYGSGNPDPFLKLLTLNVTAPDGTVTSLKSLAQVAPTFYGIAALGNTSQALFNQNNSGPPGPHEFYIGDWGFDNPSDYWFPNTAVVPNPALPNSGWAGGIAADSAGHNIWVVDIINQGVRTISNTTGVWSALLKPPSLGKPTGIACDSTATVIWVADETNKCLWRYNSLGPGTWTGPFAPANAGRFQQVACDTSGTNIWVADYDNNCVRHYNPATNVWDATAYTDGKINQPTGVAVYGNSVNGWVYVLDGQNLHYYSLAAATWNSQNLPSKLSGDGSQSLAVDPTGSVLWGNPVFGSLYQWNLSGGGGAPINPTEYWIPW